MSEENAPYNAGHDPTVTLRLELGRMTDKANAFEAALRKEVLAVVAQEVAKAIAPQMIEATYVVSPEDAERIRRRLEREKGGQS